MIAATAGGPTSIRLHRGRAATPRSEESPSPREWDRLSQCASATQSVAPWHFLNFFPDPHGQGSLRPTVDQSIGAGGAGGRVAQTFAPACPDDHRVLSRRRGLLRVRASPPGRCPSPRRTPPRRPAPPARDVLEHAERVVPPRRRRGTGGASAKSPRPSFGGPCSTTSCTLRNRSVNVVVRCRSSGPRTSCTLPACTRCSGSFCPHDR